MGWCPTHVSLYNYHRHSITGTLKEEAQWQKKKTVTHDWYHAVKDHKSKHTHTKGGARCVCTEEYHRGSRGPPHDCVERHDTTQEEILALPARCLPWKKENENERNLCVFLCNAAL